MLYLSGRSVEWHKSRDLQCELTSHNHESITLFVDILFLAEAVYLANKIAAHGYILSASDSRLAVKDDGSFHRFQVSMLSLSSHKNTPVLKSGPL